AARWEIASDPSGTTARSSSDTALRTPSSVSLHHTRCRQSCSADRLAPHQCRSSTWTTSRADASREFTLHPLDAGIWRSSPAHRTHHGALTAPKDSALAWTNTDVLSHPTESPNSN